MKDATTIYELSRDNFMKFINLNQHLKVILFYNNKCSKIYY